MALSIIQSNRGLIPESLLTQGLVYCNKHGTSTIGEDGRERSMVRYSHLALRFVGAAHTGFSGFLTLLEPRYIAWVSFLFQPPKTPAAVPVFITT